MNIEQIIDDIINGMTLREVEKKYKVDRKTLKSKCLVYLNINPKKLEEFEKALRDHKKNSGQVEIPNTKLKEICEKICERKDTIRNIAKTMNIYEETLREKILKFLNRRENAELLKRYIEYQSAIHPDYSHINFKALILTMMQENISQSQIAAEFGIPARTVSREIERLKDSDSELYEICKEYSHRKMQRKPFTKLEQMLMESVIIKYENEPILIANGKSKRQIQYEKAKKNVERASQLQGTEQEKAKLLGISVSTLRRDKLFIRKYEAEQLER